MGLSVEVWSPPVDPLDVVLPLSNLTVVRGVRELVMSPSGARLFVDGVERRAMASV